MFTYLLTYYQTRELRATCTSCHTRPDVKIAASSLSPLSQRNGTEEKDFEKRKCFKEDLKELTDVA